MSPGNPTVREVMVVTNGPIASKVPKSQPTIFCRRMNGIVTAAPISTAYYAKRSHCGFWLPKKPPWSWT